MKIISIPLTMALFLCLTLTNINKAKSQQVANFSVSSDSGCVGLNVIFTNTSTGGTMYVWDYGDWSPKDTLFAKTPTAHMFFWDYDFTVTLTVYDGIGGKDIATHTIKVRSVPFATFTSSLKEACIGEEVSFTNGSWGDNTYEWNFDDGSPVSNEINPKHSFSSTGTYFVQQKVTNLCASDSITDSIRVSNSAKPVASFYSDKTTVCPNESVQFTNTSTHTDISSWGFGDGITSSLIDPSHYYTKTGTYTVTLIVANPCGNKDTTTLTIKVDSTLVPSPWAWADPNPVCPSDSVSFSGSEGVSYFWNFGDGYTSLKQNPKHVYSKVGSYTVKYTVTNYCGNDSSTTFILDVDSTVAPSAWAWADPSPSCPNDPVSFYGSAGSSYFWDFGDGKTSTLQNPSHTYTGTGTFNYTFIVWNICGKSDTTISSIVIDNSSTPWAWFWWMPDPACPGDSVYFEDGSWGANKFTWDFGDGKTSTLKSPVHVFATSGNYTVKQTVSNGCGNSNSMTQTVKISTGAAPVANIWSNSSQGCIGETFSFTNTGNEPNSFWDFGNGDTDKGINVNYIYTKSGSFVVTLIVTDSCGSDTDKYSISIFSLPTANFSFSAACASDPVKFTDASADASSWFWEFGDGGTSIAQSPSYTYGVNGTFNSVLTVKNSNGCADSMIKVVTLTSSPIVSTTTKNESCSGKNDGSVSAIVTGGLSPFSYLWNTGASTATLSNLSAGNYYVFVTDKNGCLDSASATIKSGTGPSLTIYKNDESCGQSNGSAYASVTGGSTPFSYKWSTGSTSKMISGLSAGSYSTTVTDANGCTANSSTALSNSNNLSVFTNSTDATTCGGSDGTAYASGYNAIAPYTYKWSNGATTQKITNLISGVYTVTVKDINGCVSNAGVGVGEVKAGLSAGFTYNGNQCFAGHSFDFTNTGTMGGGVTYLWNFGPLATPTTSASENPAGIVFNTSGSYTISQTVTKAGCDKISVQTISVFPDLSASSSGKNEQCASACDGSANLTVSGGTAPLSYIWSNGATTEDISKLCPAAYTVTVTDVNGCKDITSVTINPAPAFSISIIATNASCSGVCNGAANLTVTGGTNPISYSWSNGVTTEDLTNLCSGNYFVVVTDNNGCKLNDNKTISNASIITAVLTGTNPSCVGSCDGSANLTPGGGTPAYSFKWSNGSTLEDLTGLCKGTYTVTITDSNSCKGMGSVSLSDPSVITLKTGSQNANCGLSDGTAGVTASGGTPGYTYKWNDGQTTQSALNLAAGSYGVTVTDSKGCKQTASAVVNNASGPSVVVSSKNTTCNGSSDGSATAVASGGLSPYAYLWSDGQTTATATGLVAGSYSIQVTDANGCKVTSATTVNQPSALIASIVPQNLNCNGDKSGMANLTVSGGTAGYSYNWSDNSTTEDVSGLDAGTYSVTVTDANGCQTNASGTINQPDVLAVLLTSKDLSCNGNNSGNVDLTVSGGTPGYFYDWSNGETTEDISGLAKGNYTVKVTDSKGCVISGSASLNEPTALSLTTGYKNSNCGVNDGEAYATASGGTPGYSYKWSDGQTTQTASSLNSGTYLVTVKDINNCVINAAVSISDLNGPVVVINISDVTCFGGSDGAASTSVTGGLSPYSYLWSDGSTTAGISGIVSGIYSILVTDASNCKGSANFTIDQPAPIVLNIVNIDLLCNGDNSGEADLTVSGGTPVYSFIWSNGATTEDIINVSAESYFVTVTDVNGCSENSSVKVNEPTSLVLSFSGNDPFCKGDNNGTIDLAVTGSNPPYNYLWSNGETSEDISGLTEGSYNVEVTDANGCSATDSITLSDPSLINILTSSSNATCGVNDGSASVIFATGGSGGYIYQWSDGQTTSTATTLFSGIYEVTVFDMNSCYTNKSIIINDIGGPTLIITLSHASCGKNNGAAIVSASGGTAPYSFVWSDGQTTQTVTALNEGAYSVAVTDVGGCKSNASFTIISVAPIAVDLGTDTVNCVPNGYTLDAGNTGLAYTWSTGETSQTIQVTNDGIYSVAMTDTNGCISTDSAFVTMSPVAGFNFSSSGLTASFVSSSTNAISYSWNFGDGNISSALNPSNTYIDSGTYTLVLVVSNSCGNDTITKQVTVAGSQTGYVVPQQLQCSISIHPNPYRKNAVITYYLPENSYVKLELFNILGKKIATLVEENKDAGKNHLNFSSSTYNYPEGVYILKLQYNDQVLTGRIVEIK